MEPKEDVLYRGLYFVPRQEHGFDAFKKFCDDHKIEIKKGQREGGGIELMTNDRERLVSWTTDRKIAEKFARGRRPELGAIMVILMAQKSENSNKFIACEYPGLYRLEYASEFIDENEAIALGPIKCTMSWEVYESTY